MRTIDYFSKHGEDEVREEVFEGGETEEVEEEDNYGNDCLSQ